VFRDGVDFTSSGLLAEPGLSDVSEPLFSPTPFVAFPDQSLLSIFFGISNAFALPVVVLLSSPFLLISLLALLLSLPAPLVVASLIDLKELMSLDVGTPLPSS